MTSSRFFQRSVQAAVLALVGLWPASAARADDFEAYGVFTITLGNGANVTGTNDGFASPGGLFSGTFEGHQTQGNAKSGGTATWEFEDGSTLNWKFRVEPDGNGLLVGTYEVTGGTGALAEASGSGILVIHPIPGDTGTIYLSGTLSY
jgi:hypothetical protein